MIDSYIKRELIPCIVKLRESGEWRFAFVESRYVLGYSVSFTIEQIHDRILPFLISTKECRTFSEAFNNVDDGIVNTNNWDDTEWGGIYSVDECKVYGFKEIGCVKL